jgi:hypothetical protein
MRNLIYLFIGWFAIANAQASTGQATCPWGALQVGTYSDGTPICDECTPGVAECNEWYNCPITHDPRCNLLNCTNYGCKSDEILVHDRFCAKAVSPGDYPICEGSDVFIPTSEMCVNYYIPPADGCIEPDRPYTGEDGTVKCMRMYSPRMRACPYDYYIHNEGSESVCFTVRPAECVDPTMTATVSPHPEEPTQTARPEEPSSTSTVSSKPEEPSSTPTMTPHPEEPTQTARPEEPSSTSTVSSKPEEPSSTPTMTPHPEEPTQTARPEEPSSTSTMTPHPEEPTQTARPEEPSSTSTVSSKPEEPSSRSTMTPRPEEPTQTARPEEPSSTSTMTPHPEEPTQTSKPEEPSFRSTVTPRPEEPTQTAKPNPCHCERPSIIVQERYCLWPELLPVNTTDPICNAGDTYVTTMGMCKYVIDSSSAIAGSSRVCPDGYEVEQYSDKVVCVRYYEPNSEPCSEEGTVYIKEDNRLGLPVGCYRVTRANCETLSATQTSKPVEKPSESPSITPRVEPSRTSTSTIKPSTTATRTPRRSSTPTMSPKEQVEEPSKTSTPSAKPLPPRDICEQDPRNPRCIKPDSILNQFAVDAVIAPLPTFKPAAKPFKPMTVAPTPTPWAVPEDIVISPEDIPPYIPSRMSFTDGNPTQFEEPQKVQEIQATIACTLRMPLEKIRIDNITILTISTGERQKIAIDPSEYMMDSNGTVACYEITTPTRLLRALQSTDIQVDIDYLIVEPTVEILALNTSQFAEIIRTSPVIQSFAQSVGSTGVATEVTVASYAGIQTPITSSISSTSSPFKFPTYGIGILGGVGGLLAFVGIGVGIYMHKLKQKRGKSPIQGPSSAPAVSVPVPVRVVTFAPETSSFSTNHPHRLSMLGRGQSMRTHFNPLRVSTGMADIGQAV